jgi:two-component system, OmpR family, phosphate regulon sensor histidine kinase PhoR
MTGLRSERVMGLMASVVALAGVGLIGWDLLAGGGQVLQHSTVVSGGVSLLILAIAATLFETLLRRRNQAALSRHIAEAKRLGSRRAPIASPSSSLAALVRSLNDGLAHAEKQVLEATAQLRELEIQLKVARGQRQQARSIIRTINDPVLVSDAFDEVLLANDALRRVFNVHGEEIERRPLEAVTADPALAQAIRDVRASGNPTERREVEYRRKGDAGEHIYKLTLSAMSEDGTAPSGVVAVFHDMTRENEIARLKNEFVSSVSHELRTPLASIRAYTEMLIDGEAEDEAEKKEFYEIIQNESVRLGRMIDNILSISRIESGLVEIKRAPVSPTVVIKQALEVIVPQAAMKEIRVEEQLDPAFYQTLADKDMLYQIVLNLMSNAVKYTRNGGSVTIRTTVDEEARRFTCRVIDTGVGIPAKDLPFVFDKFFRVEANKEVAKGTGLGLALVRNMVETVHKGRVFVESEVGRGSCFGFEMPLSGNAGA